jgi:acyl transferase domain-containing protein/NADP-dependent 3-hydroxy acid dehydrogenase YdfG
MTEPVAVVGVAALLPGSPSVEQFWRTVVTGRDLMIDVPASRWLIEDHYDADPRAVDKTYGRRGAFLPEIDFDPLRYGIPPNNLAAIDTSQLLALVVAEQVLADCVGRPPDRERVSVLIGASPLERMVEASARLQRPVWLRALREHGVAEDMAQSICDRIAAHYVPWQEETFPGLLTNVITGRIASRFDLHGVNHTTDAACASSLAALYTGIAELCLGRSDLVITGGVDTMNDVTMYTCFSRTPALSPTGDCRPFAADADGTMLGEGLVLFALKRLADAERDGDHVYALIRGMGASSDGRGAAIYAPVSAGQARALRRAYEAAGYGPETVELVEAHGTGTSAGDAAEFAALGEVFDASGRAERQWCALGSVKSQIGHTKSTAGAAGLLKAVLAVHHKVLPPTIKVDRPNPALDLEHSPFYLNTGARPWIRATGEHPRRASVSSFGFGGTNFHVTVEEYGGRRPPRMQAAPTELVLFSSGSPAGLRTEVARLDPGGDLTDLARRTRAEFDPAAEVRLAVIATGTDDLVTKLAEALRRIEAGQPLGPHLLAHYATGPAPAGKVGLLFPGQGAQYVGMGSDLAIHLDEARGAWDRAAGLHLGDRPLHRVVFPPPAFTDIERADQETRLTATEWAQPALAVHSLALLDVLAAIGLAADCTAGHSFGELVALHAAGAYDADTLVQLARRRGELMADPPSPGGMLAIASDPETVQAVLAGRPDVWLANHNGPRQVVVAATLPALDAVARRLAADGIGTTRLNAATAFHSPLVAAAREPLLAYLREIEVGPPRLPVFGNADAREYPADPDAVRERLAAQLAEPVAFVGVIEAMYAAGVRTFVEVGAGTALTGLVGQILGERPHVATGLDRRGRHGLTSLQDGLGRLAVNGVAMDLEVLLPPTGASGVVLGAPLSKSAVKLDGGNYGRPYPPRAGDPPPEAGRPVSAPRAAAVVKPAVQAPAAVPAVPPPAAVPASVTSAPVAPVPSAMDDGWLRVIEDAQRQAAEAHSTYQRTMAESHQAYLRMAETVMAGLLGAATGEAPPPRASEPSAPPPALSTLDLHPVAPAELAPAELAPAELAPAELAPAEVAPPEAVVGLPAQRQDAASVQALLLSVVAERTGYPVEILNVDMALDTDLGVDSIKKVEILSAVRDQVGTVPSGELGALATLRTIREIAERFSQPSMVDSTAPPADAGRMTTREPATAGGDELTRQTLRPAAAPPSGLSMLGLTGGLLAVTDDGRGIAPLVVAGLQRHHVRAEVVTRVPPHAAGVIVLDGLRTVASVELATDVQRDAFRAARTVAGRLAAEGGVFVTVQDTGGDFGLATPADPTRAWLGGLAALARTVAKECPRAAVKAIDCAIAGRPAAAVAAAIVAELLGGAGAPEVGLRADGTRVVPELSDAPLVESRSRIGPHSVIVATGGARGVTAAGLRLLAGQQRPRLVLLGRTPLSDEDADLASATDEAGLVRLLAQRQPGTPAQLAARAARVLAAREIRETLAAFTRDGATARYMPVDVRDLAALRRALDEVRRDWGPITAVVHGAGVLADARIADKTDEQFGYVFDTKVGGLRTLLAATAEDPLEVLCAFSSVAAVFGNAGQADYAMANEVLNQVLAVERVRRPGCLVRAIAWGPWQGGMVTPALAERFRDAGVRLIAPAAGARAFVAELAGPELAGPELAGPELAGPELAGPELAGPELAGPVDDVLVIRTARLDAVPPAPVDTGLVGEVVVSGVEYPYLADHQVDGVAVVPVATVLDWFARAALAWRPRTAEVAIRDLRILDKVALPGLADGGHRLVLRGHPATAVDGPALDLDLRDDTGRPHYRGTVAQAPPPAAQSWPAPAGLDPLDDPYDGTTLFHGPALRAIRGAPGVGAMGADGVIVGSRGLGWAAGFSEVDVAAIDGALQLALLWARRAGAGDTLPMGVGEFRLRRRGPVEGETRCVVRAVRADDAGAICDIALLSAYGVPYVELVGVHLVRRPGS